MALDRPLIPAFSITSGRQINWPQTPEQRASDICWTWFNRYHPGDKAKIPLADALRNELIPAVAEALRKAKGTDNG